MFENFQQIDSQRSTPEAPFYDIVGNKLTLQKFEGKVLIVNFWATWSMNCVKEIKSLDQLAKDFRKLPIVILPISIDFKNIDYINSHYALNEIINLQIYQDVGSRLYNSFTLHGLPMTVIINAQGETIGIFKGNIDWEDKELREYLIDLTKTVDSIDSGQITK